MQPWRCHGDQELEKVRLEVVSSSAVCFLPVQLHQFDLEPLHHLNPSTAGLNLPPPGDTDSEAALRRSLSLDLLAQFDFH